MRDNQKWPYLSVQDNTLFFDGCSTVELAEEYGTPLYVFSESDMRGRFAELREDFTQKYPGARVAYAAKAFLNKAMARLVLEEDMCLDVVSGGELFLALNSGFPADRIEFNGNNKSDEELTMAIDAGVGRIIVDGIDELSRIEEICYKREQGANILFRITPGVRSSTHDYIVTGKKDSKFGIPLEEEILMPLIRKAIYSAQINFYGFHFHVGSQLFDNQSHLQAADILLQWVERVHKEFGYTVPEVNLGGGFGVTYTEEERKPFSYFLDPLMEKINGFYDAHDMRRPAVVIEPGRSIVAEAGMTLYSVGTTKEIPGIRKYAAVDGGMGDNIRPALYQAEYAGVLANRASEPKDDCVTICGKCCESGDILIHDLAMPTPYRGDVLAVLSTGAYGYSMASNYNMNPVPGVVFVRKGRSRLVTRRQNYYDLMAREME